MGKRGCKERWNPLAAFTPKQCVGGSIGKSKAGKYFLGELEMNVFLILAFLFFVGSVSGWGMEVLFRRYLSTSNPERKWINPGFCTGPYLPIYGFGLCALYLIAGLEKWIPGDNPLWNKALLFLMMAVAMTAIEYIAGIFCLRVAKVRLWDYSGNRGNIQGIICPMYSLIWAVMGAVYYFLIHPHILNALLWLSNNLAFSFVIGFFFGVFILDVAQSARIIVKLKNWAKENDVIVRLEALKTQIRSDGAKQKYHFFWPFRTDRPLTEHLKEMWEGREHRINKK